MFWCVQYFVCLHPYLLLTVASTQALLLHAFCEFASFYRQVQNVLFSCNFYRLPVSFYYSLIQLLVLILLLFLSFFYLYFPLNTYFP